MNNTIVLIGFMGSGKTKLGRYAAKKLGMAFADTDELVEKEAGRSITDIFASDGEKEFRRMETEILERCCRRGDMILATGGGIIKSSENIELMRGLGARIVWLKASAQEIYSRLKRDQSRPLLADVQGEERLRRIEQLMWERKEKYENASDLVFDEEGIEIPQLGDRFVQWLYEEILEKD